MSAALTSDWLADVDLQAIAEQVWSSYLDLDGANPLEPAPHDADPELTASISVTGAWDGHIVISCTSQAAIHMAATMLGLAGDEVGLDDMVDTTGEMANVVGGNVKNLLPQPSVLSLPQVVLGAGLRFPATRQVCSLTGFWRGEPVRIAVWQFNID
jgi:chemotaxis protein CheX